ncbi:MAG: PhoH family protein [Elusimicrobiota bacterium]
MDTRKKTFVLDTNVLIHDPDSIYNFEDNIVALPLEVIEELDNLKKFSDERGRNARMISRRLDALRGKGKLSEGVMTDKGGVIKIETRARAKVPKDLVRKSDNQILSVALGIKEKGARVIFISKDINMRVKAEVLGLEVQDFEKAKVSFEKLYTGWRDIEMEDNLVDEFISQGKMPSPEGEELLCHEFAFVKSTSGKNKTALGRYDCEQDLITGLKYGRKKVWGIKALNVQQKFAVEALLRPEISLVTLVGVAGTGKTLLALACGLHQTFDTKDYRRLLISRPVIPMGKDIGYLPGTKEEKLSNWMGAFYDNLEFLTDVSGRKPAVEKPKSRKSGDFNVPEVLSELFETGKIQIEALTYLRGRSIPGQFIIVDEAQNLTPLEVKTIVSRAGRDTKVVLTGDPYQIDNPYLDSSSNGLTYLAEKFRGQELFAHVTLSSGERSPLAAMAAQLL